MRIVVMGAVAASAVLGWFKLVIPLGRILKLADEFVETEGPTPDPFPSSLANLAAVAENVPRPKCVSDRTGVSPPAL